MAELPRRKHLDVLTELADPAGKRALDIGCGDGALLRALAKRGLREGVGLEPSPQQLERVRSEPEIEGLRFVAGVGESLDFADCSFELVMFFNSLHHLPLNAMDRALAEAARVMTDDGLLYIAEPLAEGPHFELVRPVDDETHVRDVAYQRLQAAAQGQTLQQVCETSYDAPLRYADFAEFRKKMEAIDPARAQAFAESAEALEGAFERLAERTPEGYLFSQPMRVNLLRRRQEDAGRAA